MKIAHLKNIWLGEQVWKSKVSCVLFLWGFCEHSLQKFPTKDRGDKYMQKHYV